MSGLIARNGEADTLAHRAALEAVAGVHGSGQPVSEEAVRSWLGVVFAENVNLIAPAMHYAQRIINGPKPNE